MMTAPSFDGDALFESLHARRRFVVAGLTSGAAADPHGAARIIETAFSEERADALFCGFGRALAEEATGWRRGAHDRWRHIVKRHTKWSASRRLADLVGHVVYARLPEHPASETLAELCIAMGCELDERTRCTEGFSRWQIVTRRARLLPQLALHRDNPHRNGWHRWLVKGRGNRHLFRQMLWRLALDPRVHGDLDLRTVDRLDWLELALFEADRPGFAELLTALICRDPLDDTEGPQANNTIPLEQIIAVWARLEASAGERRGAAAWLRAFDDHLDDALERRDLPPAVRFALTPTDCRSLVGDDRAGPSEAVVWITGRAGLVLAAAGTRGGRARARLSRSTNPKATTVAAALAYVVSESTENTARLWMPSVTLWEPFIECLAAWAISRALPVLDPSDAGPAYSRWRLFRDEACTEPWNAQALFRRFVSIVVHGEPPDLVRLRFFVEPQTERAFEALSDDAQAACLEVDRSGAFAGDSLESPPVLSAGLDAARDVLARRGLTLMDVHWGGALKASLYDLYAAQRPQLIERIRDREAGLHPLPRDRLQVSSWDDGE